MSGMSVKTRLICTIVMFGLASLVSTNSTAQSVTCTYTSSEAANTGPGSGAYGINRFDATVGTWADTSFNAHGFYRSPQGKIVRFSIPKAVNTYPQGINDRGTIVGYFQNVSDNGSANGFKIGDGEVSHITYPGATYTEPHGINKKGDIVGWYALPNSPGAGFRLSGGQFSSFSYPGAAFATVAWGINKSGEIVGMWEDSSINQSGFIYNHGQFQNVSYPGSTGTILTGVNDAGEISGYYLGPGPDQIPYGFVYSNGTFHPVNIPNTASNIVFGVNAKGDLAGVYQAVQFGNTPPSSEPTAIRLEASKENGSPVSRLFCEEHGAFLLISSSAKFLLRWRPRKSSAVSGGLLSASLNHAMQVCGRPLNI